MNSFGADILECYIPLVETYSLRENAEFLDYSQNYVIISGILRNREAPSDPVFSDGMLVTNDKK